MRTRAAVAMEAGKPLEIMEVNLEGPKAGEVLVEIKATGICHTDEFTLSGADPEGLFPAILGHEGAGVVVECGPGVTSLKPGDHVIPLYTPECRSCDYCLNPKHSRARADARRHQPVFHARWHADFALYGLFHFRQSYSFARDCFGQSSPRCAF